MKEVKRDRSARDLMFKKIGDVKTHNGIPGKPRDDVVFGVVKHPAVVAAARLTPGREAGVETFRVCRVEELDQTRKAPGRQFESQCSAQCLIQVRLLSNAQGASGWPHEHTQPLLQELHIQGSGREL